LENDLQNLYGNGFRVIVSLLDETEQLPLYNRQHAIDMGYTRYNIPISEGRLPLRRHIEQFLQIIRQQRQDEKIIVHCLSGRQRTGAMAAAYWIAEGLSEEAARAKPFISQNTAVYPGRQETFASEWRRKPDYEDSGTERNRQELGCERQNRPEQGSDHPRYSVAGR
jgi:rhodanese-related sulfurtransferase